MNRIFIIEDDTSILKLVMYALENNGYEAEGFGSGDEFFQRLKTQIPDLILLDIMLPDMDGVEILRRIRCKPETEEVPVMMLTAKGTEFDKVNALDLGADDYVTKPFGVMELLSRIRALLRRSKKRVSEQIRFGNITVDLQRRIVTVDDSPVTLARKEFDLLSYLIKNHGIVLSREQIMQVVWGFDFEGESRTVDMHIKWLRQKLGKAGEQIQTVRGVGYKIDQLEEKQ